MVRGVDYNMQHTGVKAAFSVAELARGPLGRAGLFILNVVYVIVRVNCYWK